MAIPHRMSGETAARQPAPAARASAEANVNPLTDADALAVRAIARYNVERRQAGETPLDLKGIERLRQILADTIERSEFLKRTAQDESH